MDENLSYPPIDPTTFDLIIVGTGLPESTIAAAASSVGKSVLHLDPNPFYGGHFASLPLDELTSFLQSQPSHLHRPPPPSDGGDHVSVDLHTRPMYSDVEISSHSAQPLEELSRSFNLDLAGPRVLFCADSPVDLMIKSGASQYVDFKSIDASFVCDGDGNLSSVPDTRASIFAHPNLGLLEKNQLMGFFKLIQGHLKAISSDNNGSAESRISEEDLESPFVEFLKKMRLPMKIISIILYAITLADYDQDNLEICEDMLKTEDGIDRLALYHSSVGRFPDALGAMIYPLYGEGELPQAFCRRAAVKGCLYVLRMPVIALLTDKDSGSYRGVKLASGQDLFSHQLVLCPSYVIPLLLTNSLSNFLQGHSEAFGTRDVKRKVARGICITNSSLKPNVLNIVVVYPPKSLCPEQVTSIRVLQLGSNLAVCPSGMFVLYLSALCDDAIQGKKSLSEAIKALVSVSISGNVENGSTDRSENTAGRPSSLWSALYIQELSMGSFGDISSTPMPDGNLSYNGILRATSKLFHKMYPNEEFFPETAPYGLEDDGALDLGSEL